MTWRAISARHYVPGERPKFTCSIKLVAQSDGEDLDPNNISYFPSGGRGGEGGRDKLGRGLHSSTSQLNLSRSGHASPRPPV
jgi:hypothetical protein